MWHSSLRIFWHPFWKCIWNIFWHPFWPFCEILSVVSSSILCGISFGIPANSELAHLLISFGTLYLAELLAFYPQILLTSFLAFYLAWLLTSFLAFCLVCLLALRHSTCNIFYIFSGILCHSLWHSIFWHPLWHSIWHILSWRSL